MPTLITAPFSPKKLRADLLREARSIGLAPAFAEAVADQTVAEISAWIKDRPTITERSLNRKLALVIKKYHPDLAYLYENHDKII